jgi:hypothetical protein
MGRYVAPGIRLRLRCADPVSGPRDGRSQCPRASGGRVEQLPRADQLGVDVVLIHRYVLSPGAALLAALLQGTALAGRSRHHARSSSLSGAAWRVTRSRSARLVAARAASAYRRVASGRPPPAQVQALPMIPLVALRTEPKNVTHNG